MLFEKLERLNAFDEERIGLMKCYNGLPYKKISKKEFRKVMLQLRRIR